MLKIKRMLSVGLTLLLLCTCVATAYAVSPPYSKDFDNQSDMLSSLKTYCEQFPNVEDYSPYGNLTKVPDGCHRENKDIVLVNVKSADLALVECSFGDISWGSGVNYTFSRYENAEKDKSAEAYVFYYFDNASAQRQMAEYTPDAEFTKYSGATADGRPYVAYSYEDENGAKRCVYNLLIGNIFISINDCMEYAEKRIDDYSFDYQNISLPVYVEGDENCAMIYDVNCDGDFDITDVTYLQKYLADICALPSDLDGYRLYVLDASKDNAINIKDATAMQVILAEK